MANLNALNFLREHYPGQPVKEAWKTLSTGFGSYFAPFLPDIPMLKELENEVRNFYPKNIVDILVPMNTYENMVKAYSCAAIGKLIGTYMASQEPLPKEIPQEQTNTETDASPLESASPKEGSAPKTESPRSWFQRLLDFFSFKWT